jgi:preprotein translocase subunit SecA
MSAAAGAWPFPGLVWGSYPEQASGAAPQRRPGRGVAHCRAFAQRVLQQRPAGDEMPGRLAVLRAAPAAQRDTEAWLHEAFAAAVWALEQTLGFTPHLHQLTAARLLVENSLVELPTGDGKTAAIAMAAAVAALGRTPVHVVTANDYLARRDARALGAFHARLGLVCAHVDQPMPAAARRQAYRSDVTYCTAKELAFDYLRDGMSRPADLSALEQRARQLAGGEGAQSPVLRGLCMAILDEADTVLIDEARVPLVLSQPAGAAGEESFYRDALAVARRLGAKTDFNVVAGGRVTLTHTGRSHLRGWPRAQHPLHDHPAHREAAVALALTALHLLERDRDYVVRDGRIALVDETTGRAAAGRAWSQGLHQLVELKEGLAPTRRNATVTQISFQQFFPRYLRLAGMSGTLAGAGRELRQVYGLRVAVLPARQPSRLGKVPLRLFEGSAALWQAVARDAGAMREAGRPVLIGTESVAQSEALSRVLRAHGLAHQVLHARQDSAESAVVSAAGQAGCITVATSMAGRGTDILLAPQVVARGGLHVILCQHNASPRIDRQFLGRAGRNGQPGSAQVMLALDFALMTRRLPRRWLALACRFPFAAQPTARMAQWLESSSQKRERVALCRIAREQERELTFTRETLS